MRLLFKCKMAQYILYLGQNSLYTEFKRSLTEMFMHLMCLCKKINVGLYIINCHQPQKSSIGLKNAPKSEKVAVL